MNKHSIVLIAGLTIASAGISQTSKDTTCIPNEKLREAIVKIEEGKIAKEEIKLLKEQMANYEARIYLKDSIINAQEAQTKFYAEVAKNFDLYVANLKKQNELSALAHEVTLKELRKQKSKKWLMTISASLITIITTAYLNGK